MNENKFDPKKLQKLNNPQRLLDIPPEYIQGKLHVAKPDVLVDIGAGTAFFCIAFLRRFNSATIYACDMSPTMIDWMRENVSPQHPAIVPVMSEERVVPLDDGIADLAYMINLHHELDDPARTLAEAWRILKPGGGVFVVDWKKEDMPEGPPASIRYLPEKVQAQMEHAGFQDVAIYNEMKKHFLVVGRKG